MSGTVGFVVGLKDGRYIVTRFDKKIREFGLTTEEVDQYIAYLRKVQGEILKRY